MFNRTNNELPRTSNSSIGVSKATYLLVMCFGNFYPSFKKKKHDLYLDCPAPCGTSSTTTKGTLFGFKPRNLQNTGRLSKLAKASVIESDCSKCNFLKTHSTRNIKNMLTDFSTVLLLYRNHSIDLCSWTTDWFLHNSNIRLKWLEKQKRHCQQHLFCRNLWMAAFLIHYMKVLIFL